MKSVSITVQNLRDVIYGQLLTRAVSLDRSAAVLMTLREREISWQNASLENIKCRDFFEKILELSINQFFCTGFEPSKSYLDFHFSLRNILHYFQMKFLELNNFA